MKLFIRANSNLSKYDNKKFFSRNLLLRFILGGTTIIVSISAYCAYLAARNMALADLKQSAFQEVKSGVDEIEEWLHVRNVEVQTLGNTSTVRSLDWYVAEPY